MGPPIYIGGNKPEAGSERLSVVGFNGATDLHRWKPVIFDGYIPVIRKASMGPPIYIGGNLG